MRPERALKGRALAQHCAELLSTPRAAAGAVSRDAPAFPLESIAQALAARLARLTGGVAPTVTSAEPVAASPAEFAARAGALAANCLYAVGPGEAPVCVSISARAVFCLLDRAFGGRGEAPDPLPAAFPLSSELLIERIEGVVAEALAAACPASGDAPVRALRRDASIARLAPFAPGEALVLHALTVTDAEIAELRWTLLIAVPSAGLTATQSPDATGSSPSRRAGDPAAEPFADIPLRLRAVLVDMRIPLARLASLQVDDVLSVAVSRSVPLRAGERVIAAGTIGALDDRVAIRLSQAF